MLSIESLSKSFGGVHAVNNVSFKVKSGSITGLIGPNGAGKSTLFNIIAGRYPPDGGKVILDGEDITGLPPHVLFHKGLLRTFQLAHEFSSLTVRNNLAVVAPDQIGENLIGAWFKPAEVKAQELDILKRADEVLEFLQLSHLSDEPAGNLSGGQKKLLELGRTMMSPAKIVFLDEVGAGVNRTLLKVIGDAILRLNKEQGYTFCIIEHDMDFISALCDPVIVMAEGQFLMQGDIATVKGNEAVIESYLGRGGGRTKNHGGQKNHKGAA